MFVPMRPSRAGRNVMATSTATDTVIATATPMLAISGMPTRVSPSIEITTVTPAKITDRPAEWVASATDSTTP
jgi:hypothetical protein